MTISLAAAMPAAAQPSVTAHASLILPVSGTFSGGPEFTARPANEDRVLESCRTRDDDIARGGDARCRSAVRDRTCIADTASIRNILRRTRVHRENFNVPFERLKVLNIKSVQVLQHVDVHAEHPDGF
jgi:hypothetical protein